MRKIFITSFLILLSVVIVSGSAYALSGVCSNCHTMHYSQDGTGLGTGGPHNYLLYASCVGCHTGSAGSLATNTHDAPVVLRYSDPVEQGAGKTLAGGDFYWVATTGAATDNKGHNVKGIALQDQKIGGGTPSYTPPGWVSGVVDALGNTITSGGTWGQQLECSGQYGCHGDHSIANPETAIKGSHHTNTGLTATRAYNAATVASSYRFLAGINGLENSEWNWTETASNHNEYYGVAGGDTRTISHSCAQCHSLFHVATGATPWLRHPADIVLPSTVGKEFSAYTDYSVQAPVARPTVYTAGAEDKSKVTPGTDIVMCLSCHRAHGSPEPDLLRWTYTDMVVGATGEHAGTGCFTCHTTKDGG